MEGPLYHTSWLVEMVTMMESREPKSRNAWFCGLHAKVLITLCRQTASLTMAIQDLIANN